MRRLWIAYRVEIDKAIRQKFTYAGPLLLLLSVAGSLSHSFSRNWVVDYGFIGYTTPIVLNMVGLVVLLAYCAPLISSEMNSGAIRTVLVRPITRMDFLLAKLMLGMSYAVMLTIVVAVSSWGAISFYGDLTGVAYGGEVLYTNSEMASAYLFGMLVTLLPQFAMVAFALMVSTLVRRPAAAVGGSICIWLVLDMAKHFIGIESFLFTTYVETPWDVYNDQVNGISSPWWPSIQNCVITSACAFIIFTAVAIFVLNRRNLHA